MANTGTKEWAVKNVNIQLGCEHNCRYCYARYMAVNQYHRCTAEQWKKPKIIQEKLAKSYRNYSGVVMFPSAHDITSRNLLGCAKVIQKLLTASNEVLIVTKPDFCCIRWLCEFFDNYKIQIIFRFTITSTDNETLAFWEPGAPGYQERVKSLYHAYYAGYRTSIAIEPYLDDKFFEIVQRCSGYITDEIWIGRMRNFKQRVDLSDVTDEQYQRFVIPLLTVSTDQYVQRIYECFKDNPKIRWKDSIRRVIERTCL